MTGTTKIDEEVEPYHHLDIATIVTLIAKMKEGVMRIGQIGGQEIVKEEVEIDLTRHVAATEKRDHLKKNLRRMFIHTSRRSLATLKTTVYFGMDSSG